MFIVKVNKGFIDTRMSSIPLLSHVVGPFNSEDDAKEWIDEDMLHTFNDDRGKYEIDELFNP